MIDAADINALAGLGLTYAALAVTPGANFILVTQLSLSAPRHHALISAAGIAVGAACLALVAYSGTLALSSWSRLLWLINLGFSLLLLRLGISMLRRAWIVSTHVAIPSVPGPVKCFRLGLTTAIMNPVTLAFFLGQAATSAAAARADAPIMEPALVFFIALAWFGTLALSFSHPAMQRIYYRFRPWVDGVSGFFFVALGTQLVLRALLLS